MASGHPRPERRLLARAEAGTRARVPADRPSRQVAHEPIDTALDALPRGAVRTDVLGWWRVGLGREAKTDGDGFRTGSAFMTGRLKWKNG